MKNELKLLGKHVLIPLVLTAAASTVSASIQEKICKSGTTTVISNKEIENIIKIVQFLEGYGLLIKGIIQIRYIRC